jgi:hypothetical protein
MSDLRKAALVAVRDCMGAARSGENVLVIMDKGTRYCGHGAF